MEGEHVLNFIAFQARYGDCFLLEYGSPAQLRYMLIDGGPNDVYTPHLRSELKKVKERGGTLERVILSHVDRDHVIGLLDLLSELRVLRAEAEEEMIEIGEIWHNSFQSTIDVDGALKQRLRALFSASGQTMSTAGFLLDGIAEGHQLRLNALALDIPLNPGFDDGLVSVETAPIESPADELQITVVGPTAENLEALRSEWGEWLEEAEEQLAEDPSLAEMADRSIPNLSSIMLLVEKGGARLLLTGDGRGDHLLQGLEQLNLFDDDGQFHVDLFKIPHHGSDRNVTREFFKRISADRYVVSADGRHGNPDLATLIWIVEAAKEQERQIEIFVTNETSATHKLLQEYPVEDYSYRLIALEADKGSIKIALAQ